MARKRIGLDFDGWEEYISKLEKVGGTTAVKRGVEAGLIASKEYVNPQIKTSVTGGNLPARGKFSAEPHVIDALDTEMKVDWTNAVGEIKVGFDLKKSGGFTSIYLMYGTPRMSPAKGLKASIYGAKTKREVTKLQEEAINKVIKRIMEG